RGKGKALALGEGVGTRLPGALDQLGLVVVEVQVRRRAGQVKVNNPAGFGQMVRLPGSERVVEVLRGSALPGRKAGQGQSTQAERGILQEVPAGLQMEPFQLRVHGGYPSCPRFIIISSRFRSPF